MKKKVQWFAIIGADGEALHVSSSQDHLENICRLVKNFAGCEIVEVEIVPGGVRKIPVVRG